MANFITKIIDRSIERITNKSFTTSLTPASNNTWDLVRDFLKYGNNKCEYNLKKLLDTYENHPLVYQIIDNITQAVSRIPLKVETSTGREVVNSRILELLTPELEEQASNSYNSCGNAFFYLRKGIGMGEELIFWVASDVTITTSTVTGNVIKYQYTDCLTNKVTTVEGDDLENVFHLKTSKITNVGDVKLGLSKLTPMWMTVEASRDKLEAESVIIKNKGIAGVLSNENNEIPLLPKARQEQQDHFNQQTGGANKFNSVYLAPNKVRFTPLAMSPTDLKLIDGLVADLRSLCSAYHLSSVLFNDVANSKFDNMEEAIKQAYLNCYIPTAEKIYDPLFKWLSKVLKVDEVPYVDKSQIEVIKASTNETATALTMFDRSTQEFIMGEMSSEEIRNLVYLDPLKGGQIAVGRNNTTSNEGE